MHENFVATQNVLRFTDQSQIEKNPALARSAAGDLRVAWMTDNRPFNSGIPGHADVYAGRLDAAENTSISTPALTPFTEPSVEAIPVAPASADTHSPAPAPAVSDAKKEGTQNV